MTPDLFWIPGPWRGKLAVSMRPRGGEWLEDEVVGWRRAGLDVVVSLLEDPEAVEFGLEAEGGIAESSGLQFLSFPIPDRGVPASTERTLKFLTELISALAVGRNVALHCRQGVGRSGMMAAAALIVTGVSPSQAVETVRRARGLEVPETPSQLEWLRQLAVEYLLVRP